MPNQKEKPVNQEKKWDRTMVVTRQQEIEKKIAEEAKSFIAVFLVPHLPTPLYVDIENKMIPVGLLSDEKSKDLQECSLILNRSFSLKEMLDKQKRGKFYILHSGKDRPRLDKDGKDKHLSVDKTYLNQMLDTYKSQIKNHVVPPEEQKELISVKKVCAATYVWFDQENQIHFAGIVANQVGSPDCHEYCVYERNNDMIASIKILNEVLEKYTLDLLPLPEEIEETETFFSLSNKQTFFELPQASELSTSSEAASLISVPHAIDESVPAFKP